MKDIQVIDHFLPSPESYREAALGLEFKSYRFEHCTFHGIALAPVDGIVPQRIRDQFPRIEPALTFFRKSPEGQEEPHYIHTDIDMGEWSAILYLNENPPESDGTAFWTHRETGAIESPIPHERSEEGKTVSGWIERRKVSARFNRLVIFPSAFFHSRAIPGNWGQGDRARLTQVTFGRGDVQ